MCGSGTGPHEHVGVAGHGRCPDREDFMMQAYLHAPRRPPAPSAWTAAECAKQCDTKEITSQALAREGTNERLIQNCGAVILDDAFDPEWIAELREELVSRLGLHDQKGHEKYQVDGLRGVNRQEHVIPSKLSKKITGNLTPSFLAALMEMLGHTPSIEFVSVMTSWPGANAQELHRDVEPGMEAALFVFIPLDPTGSFNNDTGTGAAGPPELCLCTHKAGQPEKCDDDNPSTRVLASTTAVPLGSAVVYDAGLVHRGLAHTGSAPRLMVNLVISPKVI
jgi:hypothetical protein